MENLTAGIPLDHYLFMPLSSVVRYVYRIENGGQIPSFDIMCKIVQTLSIPGDLVFYPKEKVTSDLDVQEVIHMLYQCDERSLKIVKAVLRAILGEE